MTFNLDAYREWAHKWRVAIRPMFTLSDPPTMKFLVFLALLECSGRDCDYNQLITAIETSGTVAPGEIARANLRVAVRDLTATLAAHPTPFRVVRLQPGRFRLDSSTAPAPNVSRSPKPYPQVALSISLDHPLGHPRELSRNVLEKRMLPFHSLCYHPQSAAWWAHFSRTEAQIRSPVEAAAWTRLGIRERALPIATTTGVLSVVGLAVGEGFGELALLRAILEDLDDTVQVHYLAVDLSPSLLVHHAQYLTLEFKHYLATGRLVCAAVLGNIFDLSHHTPPELHAIQRARSLLFADFLPWSSPMVITYLGNCLGNDAPDTEHRFFELIRTRLGEYSRTPHPEPAGALQCIVGVSVDGGTSEIYKGNWDAFLLQGPRRLLVLHALLKAYGDKAATTFSAPADDVVLDVEPVPYRGGLGLKGRRYVFDHKLEHTISAAPPDHPSGGSIGHVDFLEAGSTIQLCAITKYDMDSMVAFLDNLGFTVADTQRQDATATRMASQTADRGKWLEQRVSTANGERHYAVLCARPRLLEETL